MPTNDVWEPIPGDPDGCFTCNGKGRWEKVGKNSYLNVGEMTEQEEDELYRRMGNCVGFTSLRQQHPARTSRKADPAPSKGEE